MKLKASVAPQPIVGHRFLAPLVSTQCDPHSEFPPLAKGGGRGSQGGVSLTTAGGDQVSPRKGPSMPRKAPLSEWDGENVAAQLLSLVNARSY